MDKLSYDIMIKLFDKEIKYAEGFGDNSLEVLRGLKDEFEMLYGESSELGECE